MWSAIFALLCENVALAGGIDTLPDAREHAAALIADVGFDLPVDGVAFREVRLRSHSIEFPLTDEVNGHHQQVGVLRLGPIAGKVGEVKSATFSIKIEAFTLDTDIERLLIRSAQSVIDHDDGYFATAMPQWSGAQQRSKRLVDNARLLMHQRSGLLPISTVCIVWALGLMLMRGREIEFSTRLKPNHFLPAALQLSIFAYWMVYWVGVRDHATYLLLQIAFAYLFEFCVWGTAYRRWVIGFGPIPIVLSVNLFAWYHAPWKPALIIGLAILSKAFLLRPNGRHIFNPSVFGLGVAAVFYLLMPELFSFDGHVNTLRIAPNMAELVLLLALVAQFRFPIVPVTLGAYFAMDVYSWVGNRPGIVLPTTLLAITLLATDPSTIPKTATGKLAYGVFIGVTIALSSKLMLMFGYSDDFSKIVGVPIANALAPMFDRLDRPDTRFARWISPKWNKAHVLLWLVLIVPSIAREKPRMFPTLLHWQYDTPLIVRDSVGIPECASNPVFCRTFSFPAEATAWTRGGQNGSGTP